MAITKTGIHVDESSSFTNPLVYEENGQVNSIVADQLTPSTRYYTRGYVIADGQTVYSGNIKSFVTEDVDYFTFSNPNNSSIMVTLMKYGSPAAITGETSLDDGETWTPFDFTGVTSQTWTIPSGMNLKIRGNNSSFSTSTTNYYNFQCSSDIILSGNIATLINKYGLINEVPCSYCFYKLFANMTTLDCDGFVLPEIRLLASTYNSLFYGCTSLTKAPTLYAYPKNAGSDYLFEYTFYGCTSLEYPPDLYCDWAVSGIFSHTFENCSSLITTASLTYTTPTWSSYTGIYEAMYKGCSSLTDTATYFINGCGDMYRNCTSLTTINIEFPNNLNARNLFRGCTSLQKINLSEVQSIYSVSNMLTDCSSLYEVYAPNVSSWNENNSIGWLWNAGTSVSGIKTVYIPSDLCVGSGSGCIPENSDSGIPSGWRHNTY